MGDEAHGGDKLRRTPAGAAKPPLAPAAPPPVRQAPGPPAGHQRPPLGVSGGNDYGGDRLRRTPVNQQQQRPPATPPHDGPGTHTRLQQGHPGENLKRTGQPEQRRPASAGPLRAAPQQAGGGGVSAAIAPGVPIGLQDKASPNWQFRRVITPRRLQRPFTAPTQPINTPGVPPLWSINTLGEPKSNVLKRQKQVRRQASSPMRAAVWAPESLSTAVRPASFLICDVSGGHLFLLPRPFMPAGGSRAQRATSSLREGPQHRAANETPSRRHGARPPAP